MCVVYKCKYVCVCEFGMEKMSSWQCFVFEANRKCVKKLFALDVVSVLLVANNCCVLGVTFVSGRRFLLFGILEMADEVRD